MEIIRRPTDHWEERRGGVAPTILLLHYTDTLTAAEAEDYFFGRRKHESGGRVSAHYMIDEDGAIYQYVDEDKRAWHAGESHWGGRDDINSHSIGIEIVNPGHKNGYRPFPVQQMHSVAALCRDILARHPQIAGPHVLGHSDVAPERKRDPGELFDWETLAARGIGVWPSPLQEDFERASSCLYNEKLLRRAFTDYGYDPDAALKKVIEAFQRHFYPEAFRTPESVGTADLEMTARLCALVRLKKEAPQI